MAELTTYLTRTEALDALDNMFEQATDVPEMTIDEINAEIADARAKNKRKEIRL